MGSKGIVMLEQTPKISVLVPVYKAEETLDACVESILAQTVRILPDDGGWAVAPSGPLEWVLSKSSNASFSLTHIFSNPITVHIKKTPPENMRSVPNYFRTNAAFRGAT